MKAKTFSTGMAVAAVLAMLVAGCGRQGKGNDVAVRRPRTECIIKTTPVKDQGRNELCWAYAMLATIESEHLMMGDSVNLSADYVARMMLAEQVERHYLSRGAAKMTARGTAPKLLRMIMRYGLTHYDAFHSDVNTKVLCRKLQSISQTAMARKAGLGELERMTGQLLDDQMHAVPQKVYFLGAEYTPAQFARSVCREDEYTALTSYTHHPFNERFALEVPDNDDNSMFLNVPIDTMAAVVERSLRNGHPVCWEGDISEPGFSFRRGMAVLADEGKAVTQDMRQRTFETFATTDDHCMEIIGIARGDSGRKYFICKNSWGTANPFGGLMYMSENYMRLKTIAVVVKSECLHTQL